MKKISVSARAKNTPSSAIRKLVPLANAAKKRGVKIYHINIGQPDLPTPSKMLNRIKNIGRDIIEYAPSYGLPETVSAWHKFFKNKGVSLAKEDLLVTNGGSEGLLFAFNVVADPGEELLVFEPFYTSYAIIAAQGNIKLKSIRTFAKNGFHLPSESEIEKAINRKTKGIVVCNPNNPTGTLYSKDEVKMLVDVAVRHNLFIISDETYQELVYDGKKVLPFSSFSKLRMQLIIVDSVSKRFNSCGLRIGCVVTRNKEVMQSILRFAQGRLSIATIEQLAVVPMLENHHSYTETVRKIYEKRRNIVLQELKKIDGVSFVAPEGAFYIIPKLPVSDSDDFAAYLLRGFSDKGETVMVAPATGFYKTKGLGTDEIRIAYVLGEKKLKRAIELIGLALKKYDKK